MRKRRDKKLSKLIDADELIERMKEDTSEAKKSLSQDNYVDKEVWGRVIQIIESYIDIIDNLPSAYDIDNVIEQLEALKDKAQLRRDELSTLKVITSEFIDKKGYERGRVYAFDDAIEVVKEGGRDE